MQVLSDDTPRQNFPLVTVILILLNIIFFPVGLVMLESGAFSQPTTPSDGGVRCTVTETGHISCQQYDAPPPTHADPLSILFSILLSMFVHASIFHLVANMFYLYIFGDNVEDIMGRSRFLLLYLSSGLVGGFVQFASGYAVGASAAVAGVLAAYLVLFPKANLDVFITPPSNLPRAWSADVSSYSAGFKAWVFIVAWFLAQFGNLLMVAGGVESDVAYLGHVVGFICGILLTLVFGLFSDFDERKRVVQELIGIREAQEFKVSNASSLRWFRQSQEKQQRMLEALEYRIVGGRILKLLKEKMSLSQGELVTMLKVDSSIVLRVLDRMTNAAVIRRLENGNIAFVSRR